MTRPLVFRSVAWYGEDGPGPWDFVAVPPEGFAQYQVTGSLRVAPHVHPPGLTLDLELVSVKDTETGATVAIRGNAATIDLSGDAAPKYVNRLWQDARHLAGMARRLGRPPGTAVTEDEIRRAVALLRKAGRSRITLRTIADTSGKFSRDNLRYYLEAKHRYLRDYL